MSKIFQYEFDDDESTMGKPVRVRKRNDQRLYWLEDQEVTHSRKRNHPRRESRGRDFR